MTDRYARVLADTDDLLARLDEHLEEELQAAIRRALDVGEQRESIWYSGEGPGYDMEIYQELVNAQIPTMQVLGTARDFLQLRRSVVTVDDDGGLVALSHPLPHTLLHTDRGLTLRECRRMQGNRLEGRDWEEMWI